MTRSDLERAQDILSDLEALQEIDIGYVYLRSQVRGRYILLEDVLPTDICESIQTTVKQFINDEVKRLEKELAEL